MKEYLVLTIPILFTASCASEVSLHFEPEEPISQYCQAININKINKIAVLPFSNSTFRMQEKYTIPFNYYQKRYNVNNTIELYSFFENDGKYVTDICERELNASSRFKVVDRRSLENTISELSLVLSGIVDNEKLIEFGKISGVDALLTGNVLKAYSLKHTASDTYGSFIYIEICYVILQFRLVDVETGDVIWNCTISRNSKNYLENTITVSNKNIFNGYKIPLPSLDKLIELTCIEALSNITDINTF